MNRKQIKKMLKDELHPDSLGENGDKVIILRWGFYYRMGKTPKHYEYIVSKCLDEHDVQFDIIETGEVWKDFKGGARVANQSHFFVKLKLRAQIYDFECDARKHKVFLNGKEISLAEAKKQYESIDHLRNRVEFNMSFARLMCNKWDWDELDAYYDEEAKRCS